MKKYLLLIVLLPIFAEAQILQYDNTYGRWYNRIRVDSLFAIPNDTIRVPVLFGGVQAARTLSWVANKGNTLYKWNTTNFLWEPISGAAATVTGANNGDTLISGLIGQGGRLIRPTIISGGNDYNYTFDSLLLTVRGQHGIRTNYLSPDTTNDDDFEITVFPDIQYAILNNNTPVLDSMFKFVTDNKVTNNIKAVIQVGDITQNATGTEFTRADLQFDKLDAAGVQYQYVPGNHDYTTMATRILTAYNVDFSTARVSGNSWYGGAYAAPDGGSFFTTFEAEGKKYLIMGLELFPRDVVLAWANGVISDSSHREVIVVTHGYLTHNGERGVDTSAHGADDYVTDGNTGTQIWNKLIKLNKNIIMVLSGHHIYPVNPQPVKGWTSRHTDVGIYGNTIHQIYVNYQQNTNDGNGYMMRLKFRPSISKIEVSFYSNYLKQDDPMYPAYTIDYGTIAVNGTMGIGGNLSVSAETRLDSSLSLTKAKKNRFLYTGIEGMIKDTSTLVYDPLTGIEFKQEFLSSENIGGASVNYRRLMGLTASRAIIAQRTDGVYALTLQRATSGANGPVVAFYKNSASDFSNIIAPTPPTRMGGLQWLSGNQAGDNIKGIGSFQMGISGFTSGGDTYGHYFWEAPDRNFVTSTRMILYDTALSVAVDAMLNANIYAPNLAGSHNADDSMLVRNATTKKFGYRPIPAGGGSSDITVGTTAINSGTDTRILYNNSGVVGEYTLTGTGTVVAMQTAPTFITSATVPLVIGGTGTTSTLTLQSTSGVGTTNADIVFKVGNNGATEAMRILNEGSTRMNNAANSYTNALAVKSLNATLEKGIIVFSNNELNYTQYGSSRINSSSTLYLDGTTQLFQITQTTKMRLNSTGLFVGTDGTPTSYLHLAAGTTTIAPFGLTSGTNLTTPVPGKFEYNGTNLFFTRTGTTRESIITANAVNAVSPTAPDRTITVVIDGTTYYIAAKTTND